MTPAGGTRGGENKKKKLGFGSKNSITTHLLSSLFLIDPNSQVGNINKEMLTSIESLSLYRTSMI